MRTLYKHVVIIGGASQLGKALAKEFMQRGAYVSLIDRQRRELADAADDIRSVQRQPNQRVEIATARIEERSELHQAINDLTLRSGPCDILVHAALVSKTGQPSLQHQQSFYALMNINYFGLLHAIEAVVPTMQARRSGTIVAFTLAPGSYQRRLTSASVASHWAVKGLMRALYYELRQHHILASLIYMDPLAHVAEVDKDTQQPRYAHMVDQIIKGKRSVYLNWKIALGQKLIHGLEYVFGKRAGLNVKPESIQEVSEP